MVKSTPKKYLGQPSFNFSTFLETFCGIVYISYFWNELLKPFHLIPNYIFFEVKKLRFIPPYLIE